MTTAPAFAWDGERFAVCNLGPDGAAEAVLRAEPRADAAKLMTLAAGTHLEAEHPDPRDVWRMVIVQEGPDTLSYSGPAGWAHMDLVCRASR
jgi:hypothetical protein